MLGYKPSTYGNNPIKYHQSNIKKKMLKTYYLCGECNK